MKTRTFRVILVSASAALLTAMGIVGAGFVSTASAAPQKALVPAQVAAGDDQGREVSDGAGPTCMIEAWLCNPHPGNGIAQWDITSPS